MQESGQRGRGRVPRRGTLDRARAPDGTVPVYPAMKGQMQDFDYRLLDLDRMPEDGSARNPDIRDSLLRLAHGYRILDRTQDLISQATTPERQTRENFLETFNTDPHTLLETLKNRRATLGDLVETTLGRARAASRTESRASIPRQLSERRFSRLPPTVR